jgi:hypothetical protein
LADIFAGSSLFIRLGVLKTLQTGGYIPENPPFYPPLVQSAAGTAQPSPTEKKEKKDLF